MSQARGSAVRGWADRANKADLRIVAVAIWVVAVGCALLPGDTRGVAEIALMIGGPAWAATRLVKALDREFELAWAVGVIVTLAEWALAILGVLWAGVPLRDVTVLVMLLALLLWPTIIAQRRRHSATGADPHRASGD